MNTLKGFFRRNCLLLVAVIGLSCCFQQESKAQFYSVSANALALMTGTFDVDASMTLNRNWSLHSELSINPWRIERFRVQHLLVRPQVRWWATESYRGFFIGAHTLFAGYHIGIPRMMTKKYKGVAWGAGIDLGWSWPISTRWNIEAQLGGGWIYANYDVLECRNCGEHLGSNSKHFVAPSRAAISLVYLF